MRTVPSRPVDRDDDSVEAVTSRRFSVCKASELPPSAALSWSAQQRSRSLLAFQRAVFERVGGVARALRLAWVLQGLSASNGYATAGDKYLAEKTGMQTTEGRPAKHLQEILKLLEDRGLIIRVHVPRGSNGFDRRIYLCAPSEIPPDLGGGGIPHSEDLPTPRSGGTDINTSRTRISREQQNARRNAHRAPWEPGKVADWIAED